MENLTPEQRDEIREEWNELHVDAKVSVVEMPSAWPRPIPVGERLPKENRDLLLFTSDPNDPCPAWTIGSFRNGRFEHFLLESELVTHWLPMPPKPE